MSTLDNARPPAEQPRKRLEFETLIADLSSRFINLPPGEVDREIEDALRRVCEPLGIDLAVLWQWSGADPGCHHAHPRYYAREGLRPPGAACARSSSPGSSEQMLAGRIVAVSSLEALPAEAAVDRETGRLYRHQVESDLPLSVGGEPPVGALGLQYPAGGARLAGRAGEAAATGRAGLHQRARPEAPRAEPAGERGAPGGGRRPRRPRVLRGGLRRRRHLRRRPASRPLRCSPGPGTGPPGPGVLDGASASRRPRTRAGRCAEQLHDGRLDRLSLEYRFLHPARGERWIHHLAGVARRDATGRAVKTFGVLRDITERKRAEEALRDLSRRLIRAHEEERALLARELHDDVTQRLAVLAIDVGRAELAAPDGAQAEAMRAVREGLVRLSEDVHSLAYQLHPSVLEELGLAEALRTECERLGRQGRLDALGGPRSAARRRREGRGALPVPRGAGGAEQRGPPRRRARRERHAAADGRRPAPRRPRRRRRLRSGASGERPEPRPGEHARARAAGERHARHRERARPGHGDRRLGSRARRGRDEPAAPPAGAPRRRPSPGGRGAEEPARSRVRPGGRGGRRARAGRGGRGRCGRT